MSLRSNIMRFSVLGFRSEKRIELQAPVVWVGGVLIWSKSNDNSICIFQKTYTVQHDG